MMMPDTAQSTMKSAVDWIAENLGWFYVVTVTVVIGFVLWVAFSKEGSVRLGPDHSRPQYNLFTWVAMLFAAGVGIDMLFYSVTGPITQFLMPVNADPESAAAAQDAVVWTMFHYGIAGWSMYSLLGMAMGYFAYRWGMPLSIRAVLYPLLGKRVRGATGDVIDIFALVGTVFGVATSMGIGVVLLNVGFASLFGLEQGLALQIALVVVAVVMTVAACTSGVDKGIRLISELNLWSCAAMMLYILITGKTAFLLNAMVENIGRFIFSLPERTLQTFAYVDGGSEWMGGWTLFFWAFWLAWGPFVGLFLARISRGRTLREFVIAAITAPVLCDFIIVTIFGNSALSEVFNGNDEFAKTAIASPEQGWYDLLEMFPGATFLIGLATLSGLLFYLTSANSGAMVMSNFSSSIPNRRGRQEVAAHLLGTGHCSAHDRHARRRRCDDDGVRDPDLRLAGDHRLPRHGLVLESAAHGARRARGPYPSAPRHCRPRRSPGKTWRQRWRPCGPTRRRIRRTLRRRVVGPSLDAVAKEFRELGYTVEHIQTLDEDTEITTNTLNVDMGDQRDFHYEAAAVEANVPSFGARNAPRGDDRYYRIEVFTQTGSEGYDLMGLSSQQIIDDVLDRYENHLSFLAYSHEHSFQSVVTPPTPPTTDAIPAGPTDADDVEEHEDPKPSPDPLAAAAGPTRAQPPRCLGERGRIES